MIRPYLGQDTLQAQAKHQDQREYHDEARCPNNRW